MRGLRAMSRLRLCGSHSRKRLIHEPVADDADERAEGVFQADLLTFLVGAAGVADRHLVDAPGRPARPAARDLGRDLRLEAAAVAAQLPALQPLAPDDLVA